MEKKSEILAIIPARKGSKRSPKKNLREIKGKPLICHTVEQALKSELITKIVIISDIEETEEIAKKYNIERIEEPNELAQDGTPAIEVVKFVINQINEPEFIIYLQPTSPLRKTKHIDEALKLLMDSKADSVVSIKRTAEPPEWMHFLGEESKLIKYNEDYATGFQETKKLYLLNGAIFASPTKSIKNFKRVLYEGDIRGYLMDEKESTDIDTDIDFKLAEALLENE